MMTSYWRTGALALLSYYLIFPVQGHDDDSPEHLIGHLRARSAKGEPQATYLLASQYAGGGILVKNEKKALELFRQAADLGSAAAQWILAGRYSSGTGVEKDKVEAYKWALLSAEHGGKVAQQLIPNYEKALSPEEKLKGQGLASQWQERFGKRKRKN